MINYYYWFSCLSYCDDYKIEQQNCCNNILNKWDIVFHKEYSYDKNVLDLLIDIYLEVIDKNFVSKDDFDLDEYMPYLIKDSSNSGKIIKNSNYIIENKAIDSSYWISS